MELPPLKSTDKALLTDGFEHTDKKKGGAKAAKELPPLSEQTKKSSRTSPKKQKPAPPASPKKTTTVKSSSKQPKSKTEFPPITTINRCVPPSPSPTPPLETPTPPLPDRDVDPVKKFDVPKKSAVKATSEKNKSREPR